MDYAKLLLAAQMRKEILAEMGIPSMNHPDKRLKVQDAGTYEERIYTLFDEIVETAKLIDNSTHAG